MSKIKRAVENLEQAVEEETGQVAKIDISIFNHWPENSCSQFGVANKVANQLAVALGKRHKHIWSGNHTYGIKLNGDNFDLSVFFNGQKSLQEVKNE